MPGDEIGGERGTRQHREQHGAAVARDETGIAACLRVAQHPNEKEGQRQRHAVEAGGGRTDLGELHEDTGKGDQPRREDEHGQREVMRRRLGELGVVAGFGNAGIGHVGRNVMGVAGDRNRGFF